MARYQPAGFNGLDRRYALFIAAARYICLLDDAFSLACFHIYKLKYSSSPFHLHHHRQSRYSSRHGRTTWRISLIFLDTRDLPFSPYSHVNDIDFFHFAAALRYWPLFVNTNFNCLLHYCMDARLPLLFTIVMLSPLHDERIARPLLIYIEICSIFRFLYEFFDFTFSWLLSLARRPCRIKNTHQIPMMITQMTSFTDYRECWDYCYTISLKHRHRVDCFAASHFDMP